MVLKVNIDSPSKAQVNIGNIRNHVLEPMNLADHTESKLSDTAFHAYQNAILVGTPKTNADAMGRPSHHLDKNCEFN